MILQLSDYQQFPEASGIYKVRDCDGQVIYIGKASNFKQRWRSHHKTLEIFSICKDATIQFTFLPIHLMGYVEYCLVKQLRPSLNKTTPNPFQQ
ncbi:MAG: GIY-YIG nuclease family protein [Thermosynechococcaceae cyanobacterium]